jgi:hypothetical protein
MYNQVTDSNGLYPFPLPGWGTGPMRGTSAGDGPDAALVLGTSAAAFRRKVSKENALRISGFRRQRAFL